MSLSDTVVGAALHNGVCKTQMGGRGTVDRKEGLQPVVRGHDRGDGTEQTYYHKNYRRTLSV